jgi:hypothetical protein
MLHCSTAEASFFDSKPTLTRIINAEHEDNGLPFASDPPDLDDFLPLVPLDDGVSYRVKHDLLLPQDVKAAESGLESRDFTRFGSYAASVQVRICG